MNTIASDNPEFPVVAFATDKIEYFLVCIGEAIHYVAEKCEELVIYSMDYIEYKASMVKKLLRAKNAAPVASFKGNTEFNTWLDSLENR